MKPQTIIRLINAATLAATALCFLAAFDLI
jgi:hypothetical protein